MHRQAVGRQRSAGLVKAGLAAVAARHHDAVFAAKHQRGIAAGGLGAVDQPLLVVRPAVAGGIEAVIGKQKRSGHGGFVSLRKRAFYCFFAAVRDRQQNLPFRLLGQAA